METENTDLGRMIHYVSNQLGTFIDRMRKKDHLPTKGNEGNVLYYIFNHPGCYAKDIQYEFSLSKATVSSSLNNRRKKGLVQKSECEDKRNKHIALTKEGSKICLAYKAFFRDRTVCLEKDITKEDKDTVIKVLNQILSNRKGKTKR